MLSAISEELDLWLDKESSITDGYQYEDEFTCTTYEVRGMKTAHRINQILFAKSLGDVSCNRNKKKLHTCFGEVSVNKTHVLCQYTSKFGSSKLQELMCLLAHDHVFDESENLFRALLGLDVCAKQIQRVSEHHGAQLEEHEKIYQEDACQTQEVPLVPQSVPVVSKDSEESIYVMVDGSMVYTREDKWKEMKVGRIYSENSRVLVSKNRTEVTDSLYVCTLGGKNDFFKKFDPYVEPYRKKIFIADGAKWVWNWVDDFYLYYVRSTSMAIRFKFWISTMPSKNLAHTQH